MSRTTGNRGRLAPHQGEKKLALKWAHEYLAVPLPTPVYPIDVSENIVDFYMLGNGPDPTNPPQYADGVGDCGEAGVRHIEMTTAVAAGQAVPVFTASEAIDEYMTYTGGQDSGVNLADFLLWLYKKGRIKAFAPLDHNNAAACDGFMALGFGTYDGVSLTDDADQLFSEEKPWTVSNGEQPDPNEGHCIVTVGSTGPASTDLDIKITWGARQPATRAWTKACTEERWLVVTTEEQAAKFAPALLADIKALGGVGGSPPAPPVPPTPAPTPPTPNPTPAPSVLEKALNAVVKGLETAIAEIKQVISEI